MFRGSHELRTHWIFYIRREDFVYVCTSVIVEMPSKDVGQGIKFTRMAGAPQSHGDSGLIKHPANRQHKHTFPEAIPRVLLEKVDRFEVVLESRWLEFRVRLSKIVACELRVLLDSTT